MYCDLHKSPKPHQTSKGVDLSLKRTVNETRQWFEDYKKLETKFAQKQFCKRRGLKFHEDEGIPIGFPSLTCFMWKSLDWSADISSTSSLGSINFWNGDQWLNFMTVSTFVLEPVMKRDSTLRKHIARRTLRWPDMHR